MTLRPVFFRVRNIMAKLSYKNQYVNTLEAEKVLDAFLRQGISIPFSCRDGVCHSCKQIAVSGSIPAAAQKGLHASQREQGYFLPCLCIPTEDMVILSPLDARLYTATIVQEKELLSQDICRLLLEPVLVQSCQAGQKVNLRRGDGEERSCTIVNQPAEEYFLEVHVHRVEGDRFSIWVFDQLEAGGELEIQGPFEGDAVEGITEASHQPELTVDAAIPNAESLRPKDPPPDLELWAALQEGKMMMEILQDFYSRVYKDELLLPYFHGMTMQRSIEKVYSFMRQIFTGEKSFFGDRPRNSHHWMVISEETFKYREALMIACQRRAGLPEEMIRRWIAVENHYKQDIVKSEPRKRVVGGEELPLEGFGEMILDSGSMCDGCGQVVEVGEKVRYHLRIGSMYCGQCNGQAAEAVR